MSGMTTQEAIHIMSEEAVRWRRLAHDLAQDPLDQDGRALEHAKRYNEKAEAAGTLIHLGRVFVAQEMEQRMKGAGDG